MQMETKELVSCLRICGNRTFGCEGCTLARTGYPMCFDRLKLMAAKELEILTAENAILHGRRMSDEKVGADATN